MSLSRFSDILAGTLMRMNQWKCRKSVLPSTQIKLIPFNDQYYRLDHAVTSSRRVIGT